VASPRLDSVHELTDAIRLEIAMLMHGEVALREAIADVRAFDALAAEFPTLPDRILTSVLDAYRREGLSRAKAVRLALRRLHDACAI
jgi:hypothetical protein